MEETIGEWMRASSGFRIHTATFCVHLCQAGMNTPKNQKWYQKSILRNFWHSAKACHTFEEKSRPNKQVLRRHLYGKYTFLWCRCSWTKTREFWPYICPNMPHSWITHKRTKALTFAHVRNFNNRVLPRVAQASRRINTTPTKLPKQPRHPVRIKALCFVMRLLRE